MKKKLIEQLYLFLDQEDMCQKHYLSQLYELKGKCNCEGCELYRKLKKAYLNNK